MVVIVMVVIVGDTDAVSPVVWITAIVSVTAITEVMEVTKVIKVGEVAEDSAFAGMTNEAATANVTKAATKAATAASKTTPCDSCKCLLVSNYRR